MKIVLYYIVFVMQKWMPYGTNINQKWYIVPLGDAYRRFTHGKDME